MSSTEKRYQRSFNVSWDQLHRDAKALAWRLSEIKPWDKVIAITRGGLVPSAIVARELEIRLIDTICISSYDHQSQSEVNVIKPAEDLEDNVLLIDDLVDTGRTAKAVRKYIPNAHFATIYVKPAGRPMVDTYVTEVSQNTWIFFPWDTALTFVDPIIANPE